MRTAVEFYRKCIEVDSNPKRNKYISLALANLAQLYDEAGSTKHAIKYYNDSIRIDLEENNYNGLYNSTIHLAEIYASSDDKKALEYNEKALDYAEKLKEPFYIAGASLALGDFYFLRRNNENAYKYFIKAYKIAQNSFTKDNLQKITSRLEDVKRRLKETELKILQEKYGK